MQKPTPLSKGTPSNPLSQDLSSFFQWLCLLGFAVRFLHMPLSRLQFYIKFQKMFFGLFKCERKMSTSAKKCVSLKLSLMGCFGPIDSTSCTHPGSSMLSSTLTDRSFLPQEVYHVSRTVFLIFFYGVLMLSLSLPQLDAPRSGKWMPTTVRRFLFAPVILLSLASPHTFSYPHLP